MVIFSYGVNSWMDAKSGWSDAVSDFLWDILLLLLFLALKFKLFYIMYKDCKFTEERHTSTPNQTISAFSIKIYSFPYSE